MKKLIMFATYFAFVWHAKAASCGADPWFNETVEIHESSLPKGIAIERGEFDSYLVNPSVIPLIINQKSANKYFHQKLVANEWYYVDYSSEPMIDANSPKWKIMNTGNAGISFHWLARGTGLRRAREGDDRPKDVEVPRPVKFKIPAIYGSKAFVIEGVIRYSLNEKYQADAQKKCMEKIR